MTTKLGKWKNDGRVKIDWLFEQFVVETTYSGENWNSYWMECEHDGLFTPGLPKASSKWSTTACSRRACPSKQSENKGRANDTGGRACASSKTPVQTESEL